MGEGNRSNVKNLVLLQCFCVRHCHSETPKNQGDVVFMCMRVVTVVPDSLRPYGLETTRLLCPWDSPARILEWNCHALLQGIFPTQGLNPHLLCLLHCRQILYPLSHLGSPMLCLETSKQQQIFFDNNIIYDF